MRRRLWRSKPLLRKPAKRCQRRKRTGLQGRPRFSGASRTETDWPDGEQERPDRRSSPRDPREPAAFKSGRLRQVHPMPHDKTQPASAEQKASAPVLPSHTVNRNDTRFRRLPQLLPDSISVSCGAQADFQKKHSWSFINRLISGFVLQVHPASRRKNRPGQSAQKPSAPVPHSHTAGKTERKS